MGFMTDIKFRVNPLPQCASIIGLESSLYHQCNLNRNDFTIVEERGVLGHPKYTVTIKDFDPEDKSSLVRKIEKYCGKII
jgi:hypothetical protein